MPGGGAGRKDEIGKSGVYRVSGPQPPADAPIVGMASWGQGPRGASGYEDHGESEIIPVPAIPEKCRDIMTKDPVCCTPEDSAHEAARIMKEHDIGVLPVVENQISKKIVGLLTDRDLVLRVIAEGRDPATSALGLVMSRRVVSCSPDDGYDQALDLMEKNRVKRMPVVDRSGRVVGIISESDVALRVRDRRKTGEFVEDTSQPDPV